MLNIKIYILNSILKFYWIKIWVFKHCILSTSLKWEKNSWARGDVEFFFVFNAIPHAANGWHIELNTTGENSYLQATTYYFVYYVNILPTKRRRLNSHFKKRTRCHSFIALNRASNVPAAQTHMKNYHFSRVVIQLFSLVEIPIRHSSLYNKWY